VTWFGHSSLLLEIDGMRVLLDPVWEQRASPFQWMGPKRFFQPTLRLEDLPALDVVLISHDHYDHLGAETVGRLAGLPSMANARWVTSLGVGDRLQRFGVPAERVTELDWTESVRIPAIAGHSAIELTAWPARHFSGRGLRDRFTTLWSSFVIEGPRHRVYFGADSGWWEGFAEIAAQYSCLPSSQELPAGRHACFDLTLLEIGAFHPLWASIHLGPDGAMRAYEAMGGSGRAGLFLPIHWGLFNLAIHGWRQPIERLLELASEREVGLFLPRPGEPAEIVHGQPKHSEWWRVAVQQEQTQRVTVPD
jgi:L-ascorbate metabolism protein UlaG (beta-lactamase superfamily)